MQECDETKADRSADDLHQDEGRRRGRRDAGERVGEGAGQGDRGVGEAGGAGEPVRRGDVAADGVGDGLESAGADAAEDDDDQPRGGDDLGQQRAGRGAVVIRQGDGVELEHQVGEHAADHAADDLGSDRERRLAGGDQAEHALDRGDDRVEAGRDRLERQDQRDQGGTGDQAVLQQLQAHVVRREALGRDAGADDGHHQERRTDRFRGHPATEVHPATPPMSAPRSARASGWTR